MNEILEYILFAFGYLYAFWMLFVFTMGIYRAFLMKRLTIPIKILGFPFVLLAGIVDVSFNMIPATIIFLEFPKEWTLSQRFIRYLTTVGRSSTLWKWRIGVASFVCDQLLDVFDPSGDHCHN